MHRPAISRYAPLCGALALGAAALLPAVGQAQTRSTAPGADLSAIDAQYRRDVQRCNSGQTGQDRTACLREAGAARDEARRGRLDDRQNGRYQQNALERCKRLPASQQQDCLTQMNAPSRTSGSVEGGGVLRETVIPVPATPASPAPMAPMPAQPPAVAPTPGGGLAPVPAAPPVVR